MTTVPPQHSDKPIREDLLDELAQVFADEVRHILKDPAESRALAPAYDYIRRLVARWEAEDADAREDWSWLPREERP
jgi:hypothetical protein